MNRRKFLEILGLASAGGIVAYSFPKIIVPKNIIVPNLIMKISDSPEYGFGFYGNVIDFKTIEASYRRACKGTAEPQYFLANQRFFDFMARNKQLYNV